MKMIRLLLLEQLLHPVDHQRPLLTYTLRLQGDGSQLVTVSGGDHQLPADAVAPILQSLAVSA